MADADRRTPPVPQAWGENLGVSCAGATPKGTSAAEAPLVVRTRAGDEDAFAALFHAHHAPLVRFAARLLAEGAGVDGAAAVAEDVVQDVFLSLWARRAAWTPGPSVRAYLFGAVRHATVSARRRRAVAARHAPQIPAALARPADDPAAHTIDAERAAAVRAAVVGLPARCRAAFTLVREDGLSYAEAAAVLGVAVKTIDAQMARAAQALRRALASHWP